mmetsp:Transcript_94973/g.283595  ORF Transcript_94973/g.283595 Transcript_94973/m.283595 type:complete len:232 (+) Transcript_94973:113-808(+)
MSDGQRVLPQDGHVGVVGIAVDGPVGPANLVVVSHVAHQVVPPQGLCMLPKLPEPHRCRGLFAARAVLEEEAPPSVELVLEGPVSAEAGPDAQQRGQSRGRHRGGQQRARAPRQSAAAAFPCGARPGLCRLLRLLQRLGALLLRDAGILRGSAGGYAEAAEAAHGEKEPELEAREAQEGSKDDRQQRGQVPGKATSGHVLREDHDHDQHDHDRQQHRQRLEAEERASGEAP